MRISARLFVVVASIGFIAQGASAANDTGCGLGSMIIKENTKLMQIFAATSNGLAGNQTFGITTGTSNCKAQNFVLTERAVQYFAEVNKDDLSREMAKGEGEKLQTLAALYGCETDATRAQFAKAAQAAYTRILPAADTDVSDMVKNLNRETAVIGACTAI